MAEQFPNNPENKLVISCALAGAATRKEQNPAVFLLQDPIGDKHELD